MTSSLHRCPLMLGLLAVLAATAAGWGATTTGVYDENLVEPNTVEFTAEGSSVDYATFRSHVAGSYPHDYAGVIDGGSVAASWSYGAGAAKTLAVQATAGTFFQQAAGSADCQPISTTSLWSSQGARYALSVDLGPVANGRPCEGVVEFGVTVLSRTLNAQPVDYGTVTATALLSGGGELTATRNVQELAGQGDTFFGFAAPAGQSIRRVSLGYDAGPGLTGPLCVDDLGFVTAPIPACPSQMRWAAPLIDGEARSDGGAGFTVTTDGPLMQAGWDDGAPGESRGLMEFALDDIPAGATVRSASLMAHVWGFDYDSSLERFPSVAVYAHAGDGALTAADAAPPASLIGRFEEISSTEPYTIDLDAAFIQALLDGDEDYLTLALMQEANDLQATFVTNEGGHGSLQFLEPQLVLEYDCAEVLVAGDANFDGKVDLNDFVALKLGFNTALTWNQGDFNTDMKVDLNDFVILKQNFGTGAVPEPCSLLLLIAGFGPAVRRPRRRRGRYPQSTAAASPVLRWAVNSALDPAPQLMIDRMASSTGTSTGCTNRPGK